jgi:hypothetical protein
MASVIAIPKPSLYPQGEHKCYIDLNNQPQLLNIPLKSSYYFLMGLTFGINISTWVEKDPSPKINNLH